MKFDNIRFRKTIRGETTQAELAKKIGADQPKVHRMLQRGENMRIHEFLAICDAIDVNPSQFLIEEVSQ